MDIYIPKSLMTAEYKNYSAEAKLLFSILLTNSATATSIMQVASLIENIGAAKSILIIRSLKNRKRVCSMKFDFFRGNECEQYLFYRVPQVLFTDDEFRYISSEAKLLYGFLLDRTALSAKNKWTDEDGKVYVYFTQDEAKEKLNIGTGKATKIFSELDEIGLIIRIRQGQGNPCKIYVMNLQNHYLRLRPPKIRSLKKAKWKS